MGVWTSQREPAAKRDAFTFPPFNMPELYFMTKTNFLSYSK